MLRMLRMLRVMRASRLLKKFSVAALLFLVLAVSAWVLFSGEAYQREWSAASQAALQRPTGYPQLVSYQPLPEMDGQMCQWVPASASLVATLRQDQQSARMARASDQLSRAEAAQRDPLRVIRDPYAAYSSVAVDPVRNEVVVTDENLFNILVYDRLANTPPTASMTEPKRIIGGLKTNIQFNCGIYIEPKSGDIYAVNNDTVQKLVVFSRQAKGDVTPDRELETPYGSFGIAVDEENQELFLTVQHDSAVVVYRKMAQGDEAPIRLLQGDRTRLADPHGIALDTKNNLMFVVNQGTAHKVRAQGKPPRKENWPLGNFPLGRHMVVPGTGAFFPPSIAVYPRGASGDTPPLRVMEGPKTELNWPTGIAIDSEHDELFVANEAGDSILVFRASASGDVAPIRVLKGPQSLIKNPSGLYMDTENDELWVANFGNHTVTVHKRTAAGDTPPLRVIRSAPLDAQATLIGNPHTVAYDSKREEILIPN